ncbi:hypothetical protein [Marinicella sp. W31]|uniref:hypothetical protein n=1 Tax=Marinicella sp. W31 TaxID=3023713 RepID=UPI003756E64D
MKHHFGDHLDRSGDYWTIVPNRNRYMYRIDETPNGSKEITIVTVTKEDEKWEKIYSLPNLEELTFHEPSKEQLEGISKLWKLKRLRITHARSKDIEFLSTLVNLEELILEYVSGFSYLSPLRELPKLKSVHFENLRGVSNFEGLSGLKSLRYLSIDGTLDWKQPISTFEFLHGLPNLEILSLGQIINKSPYPALLPALSLKKLKKLSISWTMLEAEEYALLEIGMPHVEGAVRGPFTRLAYSTIPLSNNDIRAHLSDEVIERNHPEVSINYNGERHVDDPSNTWLEFTGKKAGRTKVGSPKEKEKCEAYVAKYELMKERAKQVIACTE